MKWLGLAAATALLVTGAPARAEPLLEAARMYDSEGNREKARTLYSAYLQRHPDDAAVRIRVGELSSAGSGDPGDVAAKLPSLPVSVLHLEPTPVYKRGWFWGVVVGAVAVTGAAIALAVVYSGGSGGDAPPPGNTQGGLVQFRF